MANSFRIAELFVEELRFSRGRAVVNLTRFAQNKDCSQGTLSKAIDGLIEAGIINRSSERVLDGFEYWFVDSRMITDKWREILQTALKINMAANRQLTLKQRFGVLYQMAKAVESSAEKEVAILKEAVSKRDQRILELEKENLDKDSQLNIMLYKIKELDTANQEAITTANLYEEQIALLKKEAETLKEGLRLSDSSLVAQLLKE